MNTHVPEEALHGPQVFLSRLPPPIPLGELPGRLLRLPIDPAQLGSQPAAMREFFLDAHEALFIPTSPILDPAMGLQQLLRRALVQLNPQVKGNLIRTNRIAVALQKNDLTELGSCNGGGMITSGVTGLFKSSLTRRTLEVIAPEQVLVYEPGEVPGGYRVVQVVYLYVDHPSNGTRGALLKRILFALDAQLGTEYGQQHKRTVNLDSLLMVTVKLLTLHRVALLVIDEKQGVNFGERAYSIEFVLFYLSLMNLGISVALIGNPLAFERLESFSQVMRRFSVGGIHRLRPATEDDKWWRRDLVTGVAKFDLVDRWEVPLDVRASIGMARAGGDPGLYVALQVEVQRVALRRGGAEIVVREEDYALAAQQPRYVELMKIANALNGQSGAATGYVDLPQEEQASHGAEADLSTQLGVSGAAGERIKTLLARFKAQQTRAVNQLDERIKELKNMSPDDMRVLGVTDGVLRQLESQLEELSAPVRTAPRRAPRKAKKPGSQA